MKTFPTIRSVNLLYLVTMVLIVTAGAAMQSRSAGWGLIGTELLLILLPVLVGLRWQGLAPRETLRLRWPGWRVAALSLLIGAGVWLFASWVGTLITLLSGYSVGMGPGFFPVTVSQALVTFVGFAVCAPVCEELLFRGLIQRGYERVGPGAALWITAALFVFYHLSFQALVSLVPIALALGYVVQRSRSLVSGMLIHFANNALAAGLIIAAGLRPDLNLGVPSLPAALVGLVLAALGLWALRRATHLVPPGPDLQTAPPPESGRWLGRAWPLAAAGLLFAGLSVAEIVVGLFPQVLATEPLALPAAPWSEPARWTYAIRNVADETVGEAVCYLAPEASQVALRCEGHHRAFELRQGSSFYSAGDGDLGFEWIWRRSDLALIAGSLNATVNGEHWQTIRVVEGGAQLQVTSGTESESLDLPPNVLLVTEWAWRLAAQPFSVGLGRQATLAWPHKWDPALEDDPPALEATHLLVRGVEPLAGPQGALEAWRVTLGSQQTAWYSTQAPYLLLRYDDGMWRYVLTEIAPALDQGDAALRP